MTERRRHLVPAIALLSFIGLPALGSAALITVPTTGTVETFDSRAGCGYCFTAGPVVLPSGVVVTAGVAGTNSGLGAVLGTGGYDLGGNGGWNGPYFAGVDGPANWMLFEFPSAVSAVSGFMNYHTPLLGAPTLEVLDAGFNVLESYDLGLAAPIDTPGGFDAGAWRGIVRGAADIKALRVINSYTVVDDLTFGGVPDVVPEPAALALVVAGLLALGVRRWRMS